MTGAPLSITRRAELAVLAHPGRTSSEYAHMIDMRTQKQRMRVSALLIQAWKRGRVERVSKDAIRYYPTARTGAERTFNRKDPSQTAHAIKRAEQAARAEQRKRDRAENAERRRIEQRAADAARKRQARAAAKPTPAQKIVIHPAVQPRVAGTGTPETVAEFIARGGTVQRLASHAASTGPGALRFDHSRAPSPTCRPSTRTRPASQR